jgi:DNA replication protein DnaC
MDNKQSLETRFARFSVASFESFETDQSGVQDAYLQAKQYADEPTGWLVLTGPIGCGKTHLLVSIAKKCLERGLQVLVYPVSELLDYLRSVSLSEQNFNEVFDQIKDVDVLVLDDYDEPGTMWARAKLFQLLNHRYNENLSTVIASSNVDLESIDPRTYSRLNEKSLVTIVKMENVRDYRLYGIDEE